MKYKTFDEAAIELNGDRYRSYYELSDDFHEFMEINAVYGGDLELHKRVLVSLKDKYEKGKKHISKWMIELEEVIIKKLENDKGEKEKGVGIVE